MEISDSILMGTEMLSEMSHISTPWPERGAGERDVWIPSILMLSSDYAFLPLILISWQGGSHTCKSHVNHEQQHAYGGYEVFCVPIPG